MLIDDLHKEIQQKLVLEANKLEIQLVANTPIDTGFARKSWSINVDNNKVTLINTAPYIGYLNNGSSKQAPQYFVESTALQFGTQLGTIVQNIN
jgi:hypothetical protein